MTPPKKIDFDHLIKFFVETEKLKTELRHSWTSNPNRQESVAEHSWMLLLFAHTLIRSLELAVDELKVMKMLIVHDLAEAITGDIPAFDHTAREGKYEKELEAMKHLLRNLPPQGADYTIKLWEEMEAKSTPEAKIAQAIDKSEVLLQHLISDISTWDSGDYSLGPYNKDEYFDYDPNLRAFKDKLNEMFWQKMESHDKLGEIPDHHRRRAGKD